MFMDRQQYKMPFRKNYPLQWICPTCGKGTLRIKPESFHQHQTKQSRDDRSHEEWEPTWIAYVYSCLFECPHCKEVVSNCGEGFVDVDVVLDENGLYDHQATDLFLPKYFYPHLKLFSPPKGTPENVTEEINRSFSLFFSAPASSANHIRRALENLLTFMKVKRYVKNKNGEKVILSLHNRIELIPTKYQRVKDSCLAIKWLGNAGSHSGKEITIDDVIDAYEIMDATLKTLLDKRPDELKKLVKHINKRKGPKKKK